MGDYEVRDNWGRKIGTARPVTRSGCGGWIVLGIVLLAAIIFLCQSTANLISYHKFTFDTGEAQREATAAVAAPYHVDQSAFSATRNGKTSEATHPSYPDEKGIQLAIGASLTFQVNIPQTGLYYWCVEGTETSITPGSDRDTSSRTIIDILMNGKLFSQENDATLLFGSRSATSCVNDNPRQFNSGANSIQIKLDEKSQCGAFACPALFIQSIELDKKFS